MTTNEVPIAQQTPAARSRVEVWRSRWHNRTVHTAPYGTEGDDPADQGEVVARSSSDARRGFNVVPTHRLEGFELRSVAGAALRYYTCALVVISLGVVLAWVAASALGFIGEAERFMRSIGFRDFRFVGGQVILGAILVSVAAIVFLTVMTVLAAAFYNLLRGPGKGVGMRLASVDQALPAPPPSANGATTNGASANGAGAHERADDDEDAPRPSSPRYAPRDSNPEPSD